MEHRRRDCFVVRCGRGWAAIEQRPSELKKVIINRPLNCKVLSSFHSLFSITSSELVGSRDGENRQPELAKAGLFTSSAWSR